MTPTPAAPDPGAPTPGNGGPGDPDDGDTPARPSMFMRAATVVGDLDSPFYDEERQRDVWNEASAVTYQLTLWLGLVAANAMIWVGGADGRPYALATAAVVTLPSIVLLGYAERLGVPADRPEHRRPGALLAATGLLTALVAGLALTYTPSTGGGFAGGFSSGLAVGGVLGGIAAVVGLAREAVRAHRARPAR